MKPDGMTRAFCIVILMGVGVAVTMYGLFELNQATHGCQRRVYFFSYPSL